MYSGTIHIPDNKPAENYWPRLVTSATNQKDPMSDYITKENLHGVHAIERQVAAAGRIRNEVKSMKAESHIYNIHSKKKLFIHAQASVNQRPRKISGNSAEHT